MEGKRNYSTSSHPHHVETVTFEEFRRLDIRVGRIVAVERIRRARRLLLLKVDLGEEERQLVAGLAG
ncbi:MAG: methionine--tRNA ligase, partial [Thermoprotei archaeon]